MIRQRQEGTAEQRRTGFSIIELLIVIAIVGIVAGLGTPTYVGWRADARNAEAVRAVEEAIAVSRADAKRRATTVTLTLSNGSATFPSPNGDITIPNGGSVVVAGVPASTSVAFGGTLGVQSPYAVRSFGIRTGVGAFERTATINVIPPLGKTAVVR